MGTPTQRALQLLAILRSGGAWPATSIARQLEVSERTVRRDAQRLREMGYDVRSRPGPGAAYQLHPGVKIPPLLFTEDEVGAVAAGLRVLEAWAPKDPAMAAAAAKLEQVLPRRLRRRARAMALSTRVLHGAQPAIEIAAIGILADAMADSSRVQFAYMDQHGRPSTRHTEPYRHILRRDHWYLIAFDLERDDWRLFRLDRLRNVTTTPGGAAPRAFPDTSLEHWLTSDFGRQEK